MGKLDPETMMNKNRLEEEVILCSEDGRYQVYLLWIEWHPQLPNNFNLPKEKLESLMLKLENGWCYEQYNQVVEEWIVEGIILIW